MSSRIDPQVPKPSSPQRPTAAKPAAAAGTPATPATAKPRPAQPAAAPKPAEGQKPATAQPAAAPAPVAAPAKAAPAPSPAPVAAPVAAQAAASVPDEAAPETEHRGNGFLKAMPAWAVSMLVHVVALLGMAIIRPSVEQKQPPRVITSVPSPDVEETFEELEDELPLENPIETTTTEAVVPQEMTVVQEVQVVSDAADIDAAPATFELTDFGAETAPASDMLSTLGAVGGTAGGFGGRTNSAAMAAANGGGKDTEAAVDRALRWMAQHQMPDGGWSFDFQACPSCQGRCTHSGDKGRVADRCAATSLALLPFLGRGYTHREGPYKREVENGIAFLAAMTIKGKGKAYGAGGSLYSQGLAGIALSESYAMTQDNRLGMPAQLAVNFIMEAQDPVGGGWRYSPRQPGDTSAVGWCVMALKSGDMAHLQVNRLTVMKTIEFLNSVQSDDGAGYGYTDNSRSSPTLSAVGLLLRMYLGWKKDNPALVRGIERLAKAGPTGNLYHDYYATQLMHHMEGEVWSTWNAKMKKMLLENQSTKGHESGSWFEGVSGGGHAAEAGGRLYTTSMATMMLEVYYRHQPLYRGQSVEKEFKE
jgi:hypothetical protein